jgi:endonuclease V-like protein UPF0215 family
MSTEGAQIHRVKPEIRVVGIDDGVFTPHSTELVDVVGVVFRGGYWFDGFMHTRVKVDGIEATTKLGEMIMKSSHYQQLRVVMLNGVTLAGFNVVDIQELQQSVKLPIIAVVRDKPNLEHIRKALQHLSDPEKRWKAIERAGKMMVVYTRKGKQPIYVHVAGLAEQIAQSILKWTSTHSNIPEALRVAHIIASGLVHR